MARPMAGGRTMRRVWQTVIDTERGDCERACVATILGLDIEEVPNFSAPEVRADHTRWLRTWLQSRGYGLIEPKRDAGPTAYTYTGLEGLVALATVPSQRFPGCRHAVVVGWRPDPVFPDALECYVVHDPNPGNAPYLDIADQIIRLRWIVAHAAPLTP